MKVIVIGGSSGIGEAVARMFVQSEAEVIIAGRNRERLEAALQRLAGAHGEIMDAASPESAARFFERTGHCDHLIFTASGGRGAGSIASVSIDDIKSGFEAKLFAQLTSLKAALPFVGQSITLISAATAAAAMPGTVGLAAINGAVESMVRPLAVELAPIRVNAVRPGVVDTPWWNGVPKEYKETVFRQTSSALPVKRVGKPDDVAAAVFMIANNGFITGTIVDVSGGATLAR